LCDVHTKPLAGNKPRLLISDGFGTHESLEIIEFCLLNNIILIGVARFRACEMPIRGCMCSPRATMRGSWPDDQWREVMLSGPRALKVLVGKDYSGSRGVRVNREVVTAIECISADPIETYHTIGVARFRACEMPIRGCMCSPRATMRGSWPDGL
jgi:hypothetical protein